MVQTAQSPQTPTVSPAVVPWWNTWWNKLVAVLALLNLLLGLFNLSYVPLRDVYLHYTPMAVQFYDPVKGIEAHDRTETYLDTADAFLRQVSATGLRSPDTEAILADLRQQSADMLDENPFLSANKLATFAKMQRRMRQHIGSVSAQKAFSEFWSTDNLTAQTLGAEMAFFNSQIRPLLRSNYFRYNDENGQYIDNFWRIDLWFVALFAIDYLLRTLLMSRRTPGVNWGDAMLRRWYDVFLLIPAWRWLRVLPVLVRSHQAKIVNLNRAIAQVTYAPAAYLSDRVAEFVMVRLINQMQTSVEQGDVARALLEPKPYTTVNDVNEVEAIVDRLMKLTIYNVLPRVQPNIEALLRHSLKSSLESSTFYDTLQQLPAVGDLPDDLVRQMASYLAESTYNVVESSYSDEKGRQLFDRLSENFTTALSKELQDESTRQELQLLLRDLLEEVKINYVQRSESRDPEETLEEVEKLQQVAGAEESTGDRYSV